MTIIFVDLDFFHVKHYKLLLIHFIYFNNKRNTNDLQAVSVCVLRFCTIPQFCISLKYECFLCVDMKRPVYFLHKHELNVYVSNSLSKLPQKAARSITVGRRSHEKHLFCGPQSPKTLVFQMTVLGVFYVIKLEVKSCRNYFQICNSPLRKLIFQAPF